MTEFELKLEFAPKRLTGLLRQFRDGRHVRLQARYFDTEKSALGNARVEVRLRREGTQWIQTAKAPGPSAMERLEHNVKVPKPAAGATPQLDLSRHAGTPLEPLLRSALGLDDDAAFPPLAVIFETDVHRVTRDVRAGKSIIEVALDRGQVSANGRHSPVNEVEFELKSGEPHEAVRLAQRWCSKHGLWLSTLSKSARGRRLAQDAPAVPAPTSVPASYPKKANGPQLLAAMVQACLDQVLPNATEVAADGATREHLHQLRVGIRRLRTALREVGELDDRINPQWEPQLARVFGVLGEHRDGSFVETTLQPQLQAAGGPTVDVQPAELPDVGAAVRSAAFQRVLLELLALVHEPRDGAAPGSARKLVRQRLDKLQRQVGKSGKAFLTLEEDAQHGVRKQLKRLRYLAELAAPLFAGHKPGEFFKQLKPAQDALGVYNDELMALEHYRLLSRDDPRALFGVGWLSARREANAIACRDKLKGLAKGQALAARHVAGARRTMRLAGGATGDLFFM